MEIQLNEAQQAAVTHPEGPALVLAGAGSGKTRVIIERLAWLVEEQGVDPRNLLALTFTNRAAKEMADRFAQRLHMPRVPSWLGTFHAFGLMVLRREIQHLERDRDFTIIDANDQLSLMKRLVKEMPGKFVKVSPKDALAFISKLKQEVHSPAEDERGEEASFAYLWGRYHETLKRESLVDFDDLLVLLVTLFEDHPEVCARYQDRYRHVLIDEYQDTNHAQYRIAHLLGAKHGNIFAVGDEDQSIYSWRGADINNILDFARDFPNALAYRLEQNYRSSKRILEAANAVVKHNQNRLGKTLWTAADKGDPIRFYLGEDDDAEAYFVAEDMVKRILPPQETAVLYRTNAQSRKLEEALMRKGVHYVVLGGIKFYQRREVKDIIAYLRLMVNTKDDEALRRVLNVPARGIGGTSVTRIQEYASARGMSLFDVLREIETDDTIAARARSAAAEFVRHIDDLTLEAKTEPVGAVVEALIKRIKYREFIQRDEEKEAKKRLEILEEFISSCHEYDQKEGASLQDFLQSMALLSDADGYNPERPAVSLMTCHSAKGLEFEHVYLVGLEEGLMPLTFEFRPDAEIEEERRLCYVAMTRARKNLTLTAAEARTLYGYTQERVLSRFLKEIGLENLEHLRPKRMQTQTPGRSAPKPRGVRPESPSAASSGPVKSPPLKRVSTARGAVSQPPGTPAGSKDITSPGALRLGTCVRHAKFGIGTVQYTSGTGDKMKVRIRFETGRIATLMAKMAPLDIVEKK